MTSRSCSTSRNGEIPSLPEVAQMIDDLLDDRGLDAFALAHRAASGAAGRPGTGERQILLLAARERPAGAVEQRREDRK